MKYYIFPIVLFFVIISFPLNGAENSGTQRFTVILDAGHGGKDPGTIGLSGAYEKNLNLAIVLKIKALLEKYPDIKVILTRDKDEFIEIRERGAIANREGGNLFVSIHCNYKKTDETDKNGFEIYLSDLTRLKESEMYTRNQNISDYFKERDTLSNQWINYSNLIVPMLQNSYFHLSERFAGIVNLGLTNETTLLSRGLSQDAFFVLVGASMPTVLIETGFLSNKSDEMYLKSEKGQEAIAKGVYKSIIYYKMDYDFEKNYLFR